MEGSDQHAVVAELRGMGYFIINVQEVQTKKPALENPILKMMSWVTNPIIAGASINELMVFYRQFATMVKAGLTIIQSLNSLRTRGISARLQKVSDEALVHVQNGGKLSDALGKYPWIFPPLHIHIIRAGEIGGGLDIMLERLAAYVESESRLRQKLRMATLYPKILILAVIFIPQVPALVLGTASIIDILVGPIKMAMILLGIWILHKVLLQIPQYKYTIDTILLALPKIGKMIRMFSLSKFYRAFSCLYAAGVSPPEALKYAAETSGNSYISSKLEKAIPMVKEGRSISDALINTGVLPPMAVDLLAVGVQTGNIDHMLDKAAEYTESEAEVAVHQVITILPILLILAIGVYIGFQVIGFYVGSANNTINP
ncbi:MAG: type II secretion system F family protein [Armatimonadota bacterium]